MFGRKRNRYADNPIRRTNKFKPHQGVAEKARRVRQMKTGALKI